MPPISTAPPDSPELAPPQGDAALRFGRLFAALAREWRRQIALGLQDLELSEATGAPLMVLADHGAELRQKELARALALDSSSLFRVLRSLRERGLVAWSPDPCDRRAKLIRLTPQGAAMAARVRNCSLEIEAAILGDVAPDRLTTSRAFLLETLQRLEQTRP